MRAGWSQAGLDSLGAVELRTAISARFAIDAPATLAFDYPTIAALVGFVALSVAPTHAVRLETAKQFAIEPAMRELPGVIMLSHDGEIVFSPCFSRHTLQEQCLTSRLSASELLSDSRVIRALPEHISLPPCQSLGSLTSALPSHRQPHVYD